ncbi:MAG: M28 family peptidase, partial [Saprospiraceae bacterium]|nr:M28 family peptidase [Saprospiraceae bacterium]
LGSQHWARNKHRSNYKAKWGINLDMVGAKNPRFGQDDFSRQYAGQLLDRVWSLGQRMGYSDMFVNDRTGPLVDDHYFINQLAQIPMIDIINQPKGSKTGFVGHWHTHDDDIDAIDKRTLRVVGQVVLKTIYSESEN